MEKGTLRADANVSVRPKGSDELRTRTELKNVNSFNFIARGIELEIERQIRIWETGGEVVQQTFDFEPASGTLSPRRIKEEADDYRYFPEPDLVPLAPEAELVERLREELPELPGQRIVQIRDSIGHEDASVLVGSGRDQLWAAAVHHGADPQATAKLLMNEASGLDAAAVDPRALAGIVAVRAELSRATLAKALSASADDPAAVPAIIQETVVSDASELEPVIERVLAANPAQVETYRGGKEGVLGFLVGQVMKETQGKADPKAVNELLRRKLS
jgi:aspartyl-tRNA(Asn)/glutamyl-tRNA(Gln) amidotransferase subunit B